MPALDSNALLNQLKTNLEGYTTANGYSYDVQTVSREIIDVASRRNNNEVPAFVILPGKDELIEENLDIDVRNFPVQLVGYFRERDENDSKSSDIEVLKKETMDLLKQAYNNPSDPILRVFTSEIDPSAVAEQSADADFVLTINFRYFN